MLELNTTSFEDVIGCLKTYEECISVEEGDAQENQNKLMYTNTEPQTHHDYQGEYRGRRRGGQYYGRGRGHGRPYWDNRDSRSYWDSRDTSKIMCFRCDKLGHYAATCHDRLLKLQEATESKDGDETQEADALMMHETVYLNNETSSQRSSNLALMAI